MMDLPALDHYSRPDLIRWVSATCAVLPSSTPGSLEKVSTWCEQRWGESRPGNILQEAQEGWIDYFDGDWQITFNPWCAHEELIIWFSTKAQLAEYVLTWS